MTRFGRTKVSLYNVVGVRWKMNYTMSSRCRVELKCRWSELRLCVGRDWSRFWFRWVILVPWYKSLNGETPGGWGKPEEEVSSFCVRCIFNPKGNFVGSIFHKNSRNEKMKAPLNSTAPFFLSQETTKRNFSQFFFGQPNSLLSSIEKCTYKWI